VLSFSGTSRSVTVDLASHEWSYNAAPVVRILPLGDSITSGFNSPPHWGYRGPLWSLLTTGGAAIDYLGEFQDGPSSLPDRDHQGTLYQTADQLIPLAPGLMTQYRPDIVLLMIGSNDIEGGQDAPSLGDEISQILDGIAAQSPGVTVYVSTLTPLSADRTGSDVIPLANEEIRSAVAQAQAEGQRVRVVDPNLSLSDLTDGVHPDDSGNGKIAQAFFDAMIADDPGIGGRRAAISPSETIVYGSEAGDRLYGNGSSNRLDGRGGDDLVYGRSGDDRLYGGAGNDRLYGSSGDDWFYGSSGHDAFKGDSGADRLYGDSGNDTITGGTGRDTMFGGTGPRPVRLPVPLGERHDHKHARRHCGFHPRRQGRPVQSRCEYHEIGQSEVHLRIRFHRKAGRTAMGRKFQGLHGQRRCQRQWNGGFFHPGEHEARLPARIGFHPLKPFDRCRCLRAERSRPLAKIARRTAAAKLDSRIHRCLPLSVMTRKPRRLAPETRTPAFLSLHARRESTRMASGPAPLRFRQPSFTSSR
jgi:lysophospholipase L1-like esterase